MSIFFKAFFLNWKALLKKLNQQVTDLANSFNFLGMHQSFSVISQTDEGKNYLKYACYTSSVRSEITWRKVLHF